MRYCEYTEYWTTILSSLEIRTNEIEAMLVANNASPFTILVNVSLNSTDETLFAKTVVSPVIGTLVTVNAFVNFDNNAGYDVKLE